MALFLFANNAQSTLAAPITSAATSITLQTGGGAAFPSPTSGQQFSVTLSDAATGSLIEIAYCTARSGDTLTVIRGREGTTAQAYNAGDIAANLFTAGTAASFIQQVQLGPARIISTSGVFTTTVADANGGIGLFRTTSLSTSSTTLPSNAVVGQTYAIEDLAKNFNAYPVTVNAPAGMSISIAQSVTLNINGQCARFRFYGFNLWSFFT